jgi:hypothetical protein
MESLVTLVSLAVSGILFIAYVFKARQAKHLDTDLLRKTNELATKLLEKRLEDLSGKAKEAEEKHESASDLYRDYLKHHLGDDSDR